MSGVTIYERLAVLFSYPADGYRRQAGDCLGAMAGEPGEVAAAFREFYAGIEGLDTEEVQELFTRTFDLNPMCTLETGWQLYGEDYQRGEFLVRMREQLREYEVPESGELPDHLSHALLLLGKLEAEEAAEFASRYVLPALDKMRGAWKENRNAFALLLESAFALLRNRYPYDPALTPRRVPELHVLQ
ncbi:MAG: nitrate reductase molybdenum cofactor assembly chaperone [Acidobacteriia bacterium]|nr:nitrate reductase molybdenum cofactor assembly chaperone [Terriglobia bacterium]